MSGAEQQRGALDCPRCGRELTPDQDWCLKCGAAARTKIVRAPNWRVPVALLATLSALSLAALAVAFINLTDDPQRAVVVPVPTGTTTIEAPPAPTP